MPLTKEDLIEGLEVELTNPNPLYAVGQSNPTKGGKYGCIGNISRVTDGINIDVSWHNGTNNIYRKSELSPVDSSQEYRSIW